MVVVEAKGIWKFFGVRSVLRGADLCVTDGERVVVLGDNGSGKSTLLQVVSGVLEPDEGELRVDGAVGFAPEKPDLPEHLRVSEWIDIMASLKRIGRPKALGLGVDPLGGKVIGTLSLGQKQRVSLVTALMGNPSLLVFDEPTNALDPATRDELVERLAGATAIIATHDRATLERVATRSVTVRSGLVS